MKVKVKSLNSVRLFATPWTVAHQAPLSVGFSRQEYWSGLLPGASVRNPTHDKVMRRGLMGKASQASGFPLEFPEHVPQNQNLPALLYCAFPLF